MLICDYFDFYQFLRQMETLFDTQVTVEILFQIKSIG